MHHATIQFLHWCAYNKTYKRKAEESWQGRVSNFESQIFDDWIPEWLTVALYSSSRSLKRCKFIVSEIPMFSYKSIFDIGIAWCTAAVTVFRR